jgi:hypothetical protein
VLIQLGLEDRQRNARRSWSLPREPELVDLTVEIHQIGERRRGEDGSEGGTREETAGEERLGRMQSYRQSGADPIGSRGSTTERPEILVPTSRTGAGGPYRRDPPNRRESARR